MQMAVGLAGAIIHGEHAVTIATWALTVVTYRAIPDEHKHGVRRALRRVRKPRNKGEGADQ